MSLAAQQQQQQQAKPLAPPGVSTPAAAAAAAGPKAALQLLSPDAPAAQQAGSSSSSSSGAVDFSVREGFKWLARYAADASALLHGDELLKDYLKVVLTKHGPGVLACVLFFTFGHHEEFRGVTQGLTLASAANPAKVLNQRISFYRLMFDPDIAPSRTRAEAQAKTEVLVALLAHRPDVAAKLSHASLKAIFEKEVTAEAGRATLASLLLLPHGWQATVAPQSASSWLGSFVTAVLRVRA
ncbi:hypothetical protein OEZ86_006802 [Tetradesmus obliquus]|nr:hypothetical protein OEZ86_006802 [Tetradesmus obliquus]